MWDFSKVYVKKSFVGVWGLFYLFLALCRWRFRPRTGVTSLSDSINDSHFIVGFSQQILKNLLECKPNNTRLPNYTSWAILTSYTENSVHPSSQKKTPNKQQMQIKFAKLLQITGNTGSLTGVCYTFEWLNLHSFFFCFSPIQLFVCCIWLDRD